MIRSIKGSATRQFVEQGKSRFSGMDVALAHRRLRQINTASNLQALAGLNSVGLHKLKGDMRDFWSVDVNGPWRIVFRFNDGDAYDLHILDRTDMDQMVMARTAPFASPPDDGEVFHYPDGVALPPSHPGETLADELAARNLTANALALKLRVPANRITDIVRGRRALTAETALRLGRYFGTGARLWVDLQASYDLAVAERDLGALIEKEIDPA